MRLLIVGDSHFRLELPYGAAFKDGRRSEWEAVKAKIVETAKSADAIAFLGDNFNSRHNHSSVIAEFVEFLKLFGNKDIYLIAGNHERYGTKTALDFLQELNHPNWHVYTQTIQHVSILDKKATFIPYMTPALIGAQSYEGGGEAIVEGLEGDDLVFMHHAITDTPGVEFFSEIVMPRDRLEQKFHRVYGAHVHTPQILSPKTTVVGSIFTHSVGEPSKSIWMLDTKTMTQEAIPLPVRGIYQISWEGTLLHGIPVTSIVKCIVSTRGTDIEFVKKRLSHFDASIIVEQYENERVKAHFESGTLDLSVEGLLMSYAKQRNINYDDLQTGFDLIKSHETSKRILSS